MGKTGKLAARLVTAWPNHADGGRLVFCPWLHGLDAATHMWLGVLSWHDANASLAAALASVGQHTAPPDLFAAVFCTDPFRSLDTLFTAVRQAGIAGIVNLPSVTFIDGSFAETLASFNLGVERELDCLRRARAAGLRVAGCANTPAMAAALRDLGAELLILHSGPPLPDRARPVPASTGALRSAMRRAGTDTVLLDELLCGVDRETIGGDPGMAGR